MLQAWQSKNIFQQIMRPIYKQRAPPQKTERRSDAYACRAAAVLLMILQALGSFPSLNTSIISLVRE